MVHAVVKKVDTVLITGTSRGLGLETAVLLAERDFNVYATMRDLNRSEALERINRRRNLGIRILRMDITDQKTVEKAIKRIIDESGGIFGLVNNASVYLRGYFEDLSDAEIRHVFETNLFGTMEVTRTVLPYMRVARRGRIVTVTSVAGRSGALTASAYCASKHAQEGFSESLAQEVAPWGIQVVIVEPAIIKTDRWAGDSCTAERALNPGSPYYDWYQQAKRLMDRLARSSPTVSLDVAKTIHLALVAKHPRLRYMVGSRARLVFGLRRYTPGELFERIYFGQALRRVSKT